MTDTQTSLARAVVAWSSWAWAPGMRYELADCDVWDQGCRRLHEGERAPPNVIPVLTDPPTVGAMLALFRRVKDLPNAYVMPAYSGIEDCDLWRVTVPRWQPRKRFPTEGEAIAYALLECP